MRGGIETRGFFRDGGVSSGGEGLRRRFDRIVERAAEAGFPDASRLYRLTPAEIELELRAYSAREQRCWERLDAAAEHNDASAVEAVAEVVPTYHPWTAKKETGEKTAAV